MNILILEAGKDSENMDNMDMAGALVLDLYSFSGCLFDMVQVDVEPQGRDGLEHIHPTSAWTQRP